MKYVISILCGFLFVIQTGYAQLHSKVDERFELTSIAFTLAGVPEFCAIDIPSYERDIINIFEPYSLTEPIHYMRELNQLHGIGYAAIPAVAEILEIKDGKIRLQKQYDISEISDVDSRWNKDLFSKYLKMLNVFYTESDFHKFFEEHHELYDWATKRMDTVLAELNDGWFSDFFGKPFDSDSNINIYISLVNGPNNYAMDNGILIGAQSGKNGMPSYAHTAMRIVLHELGHHYTNSLFDLWWPQMKDAAEKIYPHVKEQMRQIAYSGAYVTFCEWLNDLFVIMYFRGDKKLRDITHDTRNDINRGFIWMERSVAFMDNFYSNRACYPHIEDFMPQLVAFVNYTADNFDLILREYEYRRPYITNVYPAVDSDITGFDEIVITFSEPMSGSWGFSGSGSDDENVKCLYLGADAVWSEDRMRIILPLAKEEAEKDCTYGIQLVPEFFQSARRFFLDDRCKKLTFNTIQKR